MMNISFLRLPVGGVYILIRKLYVLSPLSGNDFPPLATHRFSTPVPSLPRFFPILHLFYLPFYFPFSLVLLHFFLFLPPFFFLILHLPLISLPFLIFFPKMTSAVIFFPRGGGGRSLCFLSRGISVVDP
jgi:hypothetical protein